MKWLTRLFSGLSPRRLRFDAMSVHVRFVALGHGLWHWDTTCGTGTRFVALGHDLWHWDTTCGTGTRFVALGHDLWHWDTICGTRTRLVALGHDLWHWDTTCGTGTRFGLLAPGAGLAQSVERLATARRVRGSKSGGGEIFCSRPDWP